MQIQYVRSSTQKEKSFEKCIEIGKLKRGSLPFDCKTRWNSTFLMLNRAMDFKVAFDKMKALEKSYIAYFKEPIDVEPLRKRHGPHDKDDWDAVDRLLNFFVLFYQSTLVLSEPTKACSYKLYNEIVNIQTAIMEIGVENEFDEEMQKKIKAISAKLGKYWDPFSEETKMNRMVIVASVFHPRNKMKFAQLCFNNFYGKDNVKAIEM